jgi:hypothetical protein
MATLFVDKIDPQSGTSLEIGSSGDTITIPSGVTQTGVGGTNTPAFEVRQTSGQSVSSGSFTKMTWNVENYDTNNAFASDKFTVPSGQDGKYYFQVTTELSGIDDGEFVNIQIYKNGSFQAGTTARWYAPGANDDVRARTNVILNLSAADYVEAYVYQNEGAAVTLSTSETFFRGFKLIGV